MGHGRVCPGHPLNKAPPCHMIGVAGTAMTKGGLAACEHAPISGTAAMPSPCFLQSPDNTCGERLGAERPAEVARALRRDRDGRVDRADDRLPGGGEIGACATLFEP